VVCLIKSRAPLCQVIHATVNNLCNQRACWESSISEQSGTWCCTSATHREFPDEISPHKVIEYTDSLEYTRGK
jgi:hypothetical protein